MRWIAHSSYKLGKREDAYGWYFRAIAEAPDMRDAYVECAKTAHFEKNWPMVFFMAEEALRIREKSQSYVNMGYAWDHTPSDLCAIACYWLGMYERARAHAWDALKSRPDDGRLQKNLELIEEKCRR